MSQTISPYPNPDKSFVKRRIACVITLAQGADGLEAGTSVTLSDLRIQAMISAAGGPSLNHAQIRIFGVSRSLINTLTTIGMQPNEIRRNTINIQAGDDNTGLSSIFVGTIYTAFGDFNDMPNVCLNIMAAEGLLEKVKPVPPVSYNGWVDIATAMENLAKQGGFNFQNYGVSGKIYCPYYAGTATDQIKELAADANIEHDIANQTVSIWPRGQAKGTSVPIVAPDTGMVGYPTYTSTGIGFTCVFNPSIGYGSAIEVQSSVERANGRWVITTLNYSLESETPGGAWFMNAEARRPGAAPTATGP